MVADFLTKTEQMASIFRIEDDPVTSQLPAKDLAFGLQEPNLGVAAGLKSLYQQSQRYMKPVGHDQPFSHLNTPLVLDEKKTHGNSLHGRRRADLP